MAEDEMANEIVIPSCSNYEVTDAELITGKNRKRQLSISESEVEYNDYTDISKCETSANKKTPRKDNQSNAICKRISEQSMSDVIKKLTKQIEYIEKRVALSQNFMKNTKANDEPIYQPPNKIIKYDVEVISAESCNSDENSTRSIKNINTTKNVNKKIKLDQNIIFQKDIDDSERDSYKSLTNEEVQMLLELPYNFDDEENTHIKIHDGQTNEDDTSSKSILNKKLIEVRGDSEKIFDSDKTTDKMYIDSVNIPDLADTLNTSIKHLFNGSILDNTKVGISTEDNSISQSNDCSEKSINHSGEFVNVGDVLLLMREINNDDVDNCNDAESIDQDGIMDLTNCENYEIMLNHENCTSITNKGLNSTMHFDNVNSEIQTDCEETTRCSDNSIHKTDFERIIVPEGELNDSTKHVDDQKYVCKSQNNEEKNNFESSNIEDDLFGVDILDVHSKVDCESNLNQRSLLDTNANNQTILENKNSTSNMNPGQRNERTLKRLTVQEEEMLTKLFNNDVDELGIVTNCTDSSLLDINKCEANASKISEGKRHFSNDEAFIMPVNVSEDVNYNSLLPNSATDATTVNNYDVTLSERNFQGSVIGDQFTFNMFYFGTENFRDVSVHTIQSLDGYEMNFSKNNTPVPSMENNDSLVSLNNAIENTTVELCNGEIEIETLSRMKNKNDNYGEEIVEGIIKQIIEDITVSLDSSNTFHHVLKKSIKNINTTKNVNKKIKLDQNIIFQKDIDDSERDSYKSLTNEEVQMLLELPYNFDDEENTHIKIHDGQTNEDMRDLKNILEPVHNYCMNSGSITSQEKICFVSPHETKNTGPETYEYNNNNDTSSKSILNKKLIEVRGDSEKIFDSDKTTDKMYIDSVNIPDLADTLNTSIKHLFNGSILDNTKVGISTEDNSISQSNDCSEKSINHSGEFVNVGDVLLLMREINNDDVDNCNDAESIDQDGIMDLTNCENYEIMLNHENCTSITNKGLNSTMHFDNVNSEIQTDCEETTRCSDNSIHKTDFERIIVPEGELNDSTKHVDDQKYVCKTQNNEEKNNFESSNIEDDLFGVDILDFHSKVDCESNLNQRSLLDTNAYNQTILENKNSSSNMNPGQRNERTLKRPTVQGEEMLTKLFNNDIDELGIVTDCTDKVTTSQTCEDYIYENVSKKFKNEDDLLEVTMHKSDEKVGITIEEEINLSFNFDDARQILESSNDFEHFDDSLLFNTSDSRDLVRYGIECEEYEKSISQSLNNLENNVSNKEVISQCKSPSLRFNKISKSINNHVSSSFAKDYEDNVIDFYDCDLSSIENSDIEDNLLLSFENDSSIDDCIFNEKKDKLKNAINSTSNELNSLKIQNVASPSESCNNSTNVLETPVSLIHSPSHDHQNIKIMSTSMSIKQKGMNLDADDKLESFNHSDVKIITCNTIPSFNESDNINKIESDDLCKDQGELKSNSNKDQNLEVSNKNYNQNNENKSISEYNTHQNIEKSQNPYKDNGSESAKVSSLKNTENEDISKINTVESTSFDTNLSQIEKKKYLEEIIKNEQLFNKFDEELDINESTISPYISQSLVKSTNLKNALAKRAATNINIHDMGNKALFTYLTQQTMTLDLLKVLHKSLETCPSSGVLMEDPEGLVVPLMSHQKHAIAWLIWRESQEPRGGILADDMGLGKTLSMISLILKLKEKPLDSLLPLEESIGNRRNDVIIGGTLVVCPVSLINQWETEVKSKLKPGLLKVDQYYGINRNFSALELAKNDLVITSYHVVMWDHKLRQNSSPLYKIKWDRVILDEGHNIRNHKTQTSIAVCNIKSLNRWAITGTPIHNKEEDFFTLLKFVRCKPFDDWPVWKRWVSNNDDAGKHRLSLLIKTLMLRRTKTELTQLTTFNLPIKKIITIEIELSKEERNAYENLLKFSSNLFATYLYDRAAKEKLFDPSIKVQCKIQYFQEQSQDKDEVFKDHLELLKLFKQFKNIDEIQTYHILVLLLRLRQMCCHPILIKGPITEESIKKEDNMESISEDETNATYNENKDIDTSLNNIDLPDCMSCLILEDEPVEKKSVIERNIFQKTYVSSKIKKICELVNQKILINGGNDKAIIVSQWPSFLHLIKKNLAHYNTKIEMFSGKIPILRRNKIIRDFNNPDGGPRILLLSLKAGGVGLNLMAANHMFLIDVHWNPQLEAQVCDRVYRVGQTKPVYIYKFISNNTIETRILNIQTLKLQIAENLFKGTTVASSKLTIDDLKQIFQFH